jgi:NagD protein
VNSAMRARLGVLTPALPPAPCCGRVPRPTETTEDTMSRRDEVECWLTDMDGVLVHENHALPGAAALLQQWQDQGTPFLVLTNNSIFTPRDLSARLRASGLDVPEERIWTSALATAAFLAEQEPGGSAFVIGEAGITTALHEAGFIMTETNPDYVVVGETRNYSFEAITKAIRLIAAGARFIVTNPDATGPSADGPMPATGAIAALITKATGKEPYVVGKPNPMMFRSALNKIGAHSENTGMIGDRMDTDIVAGIEAGLHTVLVLTGISDEAEIARYPFRPNEILDGVIDLVRPEPAETELYDSAP